MAWMNLIQAITISPGDSRSSPTREVLGLWIGGHLTLREKVLLTVWWQTGTNVSTGFAPYTHIADTDHNLFRSQLDFFF